MRNAMVGRSEEVFMSPLTQPDRVVLQAPERLVSEHRLEFRRDALERLSKAAAEGAKRITIDLRDTREVDASGLGVLVLLQKRARENGRSLSDEAQSLLQSGIVNPVSQAGFGTRLFSMLPDEFRGDDLVFEVPGEMSDPPDFE